MYGAIIFVMEQKRFTALSILELITFTSMLFGLISIFTDFRFMVDLPRLASIPFLTTYTGLSNLFIGVVCLVCALYRIIYKVDKLPKWLFIIKLVFISQITITFFITALYLSPQLGADWWMLYNNAGLFNHLITPLLAIIPFLFLERKVEIKWYMCFYSLIPIVLYAVLYITNVFTHLNPDGSTSTTYDIYGFFRFGGGYFILFLIGFFIIAFGICLLYRLENIAINKRKDNE